MRRQYTKKLVEDFVKIHPMEFLEEELRIVSKPPIFEEVKPDLVFEDAYGIPVIVEIQLDTFNREYFYDALRYRDLLVEKKNLKFARILFLCNKIQQQFKNLFDTYKVECKILTKREFVKKAKELSPELKIIKSPKRAQRKITVDDVLKALSERKKKDDKKEVELNAMVFWEDERDNGFRFNETINKGIPKEWIISYDFLSALTPEIGYMLREWFEILERYMWDIKNSRLEIVFGWRSNPDFYDYGEYIKTNIRKFEPLWNRYIVVENDNKYYDIEKIKEDLSYLQKLILYAGKYPDYQELKLFSDFEIVEGPGHLIKNWLYYRKRYYNIEEDVDPNFVPPELKSSLNRKGSFEHKCYTVVFNGISRDFLHYVHDFLRHLLILHESSRMNKYRSIFKQEVYIFHKKCDKCIIDPKLFRDINHEALKLSSQYFMHFKNPNSN